MIPMHYGCGSRGREQLTITLVDPPAINVLSFVKSRSSECAENSPKTRLPVAHVVVPSAAVENTEYFLLASQSSNFASVCADPEHSNAVRRTEYVN